VELVMPESRPAAALTPPPSEAPPDDLVISYLGLRRAVGIIGMALPFVLAIGRAILDQPVLQPTVSDYYYTVMGDVFVGSLCAIGVFMMSYRGYDWKDRAAGRSSCLFAIGAALFPTAGENPTDTAQAIGIVHFACAAGLFLTLAVFCKLFRKSKQDQPPTPQKLQRNLIYAVCGVTILLCIALIVIYAAFLRQTALAQLHPVFWLEALAVVVFGISWLVKGEAILADK